MRFLLLAFLLTSIASFGQSTYEEQTYSFNADIKAAASTLTPTMKQKVIKHLKITTPALYTILATKASGNYSVAVVQVAKTKEQGAWVVYDQNENIVQTTWYKPMINPAAWARVKGVAIANGLKKVDPTMDMFRISNSTGTWYKVMGEVDGGPGTINVSDAYAFLSKGGIAE